MIGNTTRQPCKGMVYCKCAACKRAAKSTKGKSKAKALTKKVRYLNKLALKTSPTDYESIYGSDLIVG